MISSGIALYILLAATDVATVGCLCPGMTRKDGKKALRMIVATAMLLELASNTAMAWRTTVDTEPIGAAMATARTVLLALATMAICKTGKRDATTGADTDTQDKTETQHKAESATDTTPTAEDKPQREQATGNGSFAERILDINTIILDWVTRDDRPWLREGITVNQVADDMGLNPRLLSRYINTVMKINFNQWINNMKVAEAKRIISEAPDTNMADVAIKAGFTDATSMSKLITGMPPSAYRTRLKAQA